jgi:menaquinol-cytochrome c reductase iron-sulfur subunit
MDENASAESNGNQSRRSFIRIVSIAAFAGTFATAAAAAIRFLRPVASAVDPKWVDIGPITEISGDAPVARKVAAEHVAGWAKSLEEHLVYILPHRNHQIISAVCPHEGCEVFWRNDERVFACPCHESNFTADGQRIDGPAPRGLDPLPSRVENGRLQVQYQFFVNNIQERTSRG